MASKIFVSFSLSAVQDLSDIEAHYQEEGVPEVGKQIVTELIEAIEQLSVYPKSGRVIPEFDVEHLREIIDPPYRIAYRLDKKRVRIIRIMRSERELKSLATE